MTLRTYFIALMFLLFAIVARAETKIENYSDKVLPFTQWATQFPAEKELLNLYPGFVEPTVNFSKYGRPQSRVDKLHVYVTEMRTTISKGAANIRLADIVQFDMVKKLSDEIQHRQIPAEQLMPAVVKLGGSIKNFQWCNTGTVSTYFTLPSKEKDLGFLSNPTRPWCAQDGRTICIESCYVFNAGWSVAVRLHNAARAAADAKDYGAAMQSEIRYFNSEGEYGNKTPLAQLTKINTPVTGVIEQNIIYFNQVFKFGKVVAVLQQHPTKSELTVMTTFVNIASLSKYWTESEYDQLRRVLKGQSRGVMGVNTETGLSAGIPIFSKSIAIWIGTILEK